ncbi:MAG: MBL fold metallo-hydrolase [Desulfocapsaceae bacterium]|nr:MBL fold metallo-hydrolase [Desulfocapsaceae bacterium]
MLPTQHTVDTPYMVGPVHCYTIDLDGELTLFDTGPPTGAGEQFLRRHIDLGRLRHVIVTHCHLDHYGLSSWLEKHSEASIYFPSRDIQKVLRHDERLEKMYGLLGALGFSGTYLDRLRESFYRDVMFPPFPQTYLSAEEDIPERLGIEVLSCPGHSQSDLVYTTGNWAVTGDILLRGIYQSPLLDIDLGSGQRFNNYQAYCDTLVKLMRIRGKKILPGHRHRVESVDATILFYIKKTLYRIAQLKPYIGDYTVAQIIKRVFGDELTDPFHVYLKASEIVFMKDLLETPETLKNALKQIALFDEVAADFERAAA